METMPLPEPVLPDPVRRRRADAERNREKIIAVARDAFSANPPRQVSMAEVARRADIGMATLYRNFAGRRELLEAVFLDEVDDVCAAADTVTGSSPGAIVLAWLQIFAEFALARNDVAQYLIAETGTDVALFRDDRARFWAAGEPLLLAAQETGEFRSDIRIGLLLDMIVCIAGLHADPAYVRTVITTAIDGARIRGQQSALSPPPR